MLEHARSNTPGDLAVVTLDAKKAFDNVHFQLLSLVLKMFGFSGPFQHLITSMCSTSFTRVVAAGHVSDTIVLHTGTRQSCPLSPLLLNSINLFYKLQIDIQLEKRSSHYA